MLSEQDQDRFAVSMACWRLLVVVLTAVVVLLLGELFASKARADGKQAAAVQIGHKHSTGPAPHFVFPNPPEGSGRWNPSDLSKLEKFKGGKWVPWDVAVDGPIPTRKPPHAFIRVERNP